MEGVSGIRGALSSGREASVTGSGLPNPGYSLPMCGRYTLTRPGDALVELDCPDVALSAELREELLRPRYNVAPTQSVLAVRADDEGARHAVGLVWGLRPPWMKRAPERPMINARVETVAERRSFAPALRTRRCLLPADGFFEWPRGRGGAPRWFHLDEDAIFALAGLWEPPPAEGGEGTVCVLTGPATGAVADLHPRMPIVLLATEHEQWLDSSLQDPDALAEWLRGLTAPEWHGRPVSRRVNRVVNDDPACIEPAPPTPETLPLF